MHTVSRLKSTRDPNSGVRERDPNSGAASSGVMSVNRDLKSRVIVKREQIFSAHIRERRHSVNRTEHPAGKAYHYHWRSS
eukprot:COSAG06_NODE_992_length_11167_cov_15.477232_2_plen_80_part_00